MVNNTNKNEDQPIRKKNKHPPYFFLKNNTTNFLTYKEVKSEYAAKNVQKKYITVLCR